MSRNLPLPQSLAAGVPSLLVALAFAIALACAPTASAQVFWARGFMSNNSTGNGSAFTGVGGAVGDSWSGNSTHSTREYLLINGTASGFGTLHTGANSTATINLTGCTDLHLLVTLRLDPHNSATHFRVGLRSGSCNQTLWSVPASQFSVGRFRTVAIPVSSAPASTTGNLSLAAVDRVIFQGDYSGSAPLAVHLERIALAEIPAQGVVRIVGSPQSGDPYGAAYYSTIQAAVNASRPRDTVWVRPGTYTESVSLTKDYGLPETALRIVADPSGPVILQGTPGINASNNFTGLEYGFNWDNTQAASTMVRANHIKIEGFIVRHFLNSGFGNRNPGKITIRNCLVHSNGSAGISMNFPRADTRIRAIGNVVFLNGWGEGWAGGIHINNKDVRLNSLAADANNNPLPQDDDPGHEIVGNISFLNLDESEYNSDGNGIMLDFAGGSEALITDNLVFLNAGAGLRNLNGRATFLRNLVYRNGWEHRAAPGSNRSTNEQIGFLIKHDTGVSPRITFDEFLHRNYSQFIRSRLADNLVWTASRFNFAGPFYTYLNDAQQSASLSQFALDYGIWSTFNGQPDSTKWWRVTYGHQLDTATSNGNLFTDDVIGQVNPDNPGQNVQPQTRQSNLRTTFNGTVTAPFELVPGADYVPPAFQHIFGHAFRAGNGTVNPMSETTQSIGMVWNNSVKKNLSPKLAQVVTSPPALDLQAFDFTLKNSLNATFQACRPAIPFAPQYRAVFENYLRTTFDGNHPDSGLPIETTATSDPSLPAAGEPAATSWLQAEDLYSTAAHKQAAIPRWQFASAESGPFGSHYLVSYVLDTLAYLNRANALLARFTLAAGHAPVIHFVVQAPPASGTNDSFFVRILNEATSQAVVLPLKAIHQVPATTHATKPELTDAGSGWYRVFFDHAISAVTHLHLALPELPAGSYEIQLQNRQPNVRLDRLGVFLAGGTQIATRVNPPAVTYADWQQTTLGNATASQPPHANPTADGSGNGLPNLAQVALGAPTSATAVALPQIIEAGETGCRLEFSFNGLIAGLGATVQRSFDLQTWTDIAAVPPGGAAQSLVSGVSASDSASAALRTLSVQTPAGNGRVFLRARFYLQ